MMVSNHTLFCSAFESNVEIYHPWYFLFFLIHDLLVIELPYQSRDQCCYLVYLHDPGNARIGHAGPACDEIKSK